MSRQSWSSQQERFIDMLKSANANEKAIECACASKRLQDSHAVAKHKRAEAFNQQNNTDTFDLPIYQQKVLKMLKILDEGTGLQKSERIIGTGSVGQVFPRKSLLTDELNLMVRLWKGLIRMDHTRKRQQLMHHGKMAPQNDMVVFGSLFLQRHLI